MHKNYASYFNMKEYLLVDSAFKANNYIIPAFKKGRCMPLGPDKEYFNNLLARLRIRAEHCIGQLKGRFQYLKRIRAVIKDTTSKSKTLKLIDVACILHNICIEDRIPCSWIETESAEDELEDDGQVGVDDADGNRRDQLLVIILESSAY